DLADERADRFAERAHAAAQPLGHDRRAHVDRDARDPPHLGGEDHVEARAGALRARVDRRRERPEDAPRRRRREPRAARRGRRHRAAALARAPARRGRRGAPEAAGIQGCRALRGRGARARRRAGPQRKLPRRPDQATVGRCRMSEEPIAVPDAEDAIAVPEPAEAIAVPDTRDPTPETPAVQAPPVAVPEEEDPDFAAEVASHLLDVDVRLWAELGRSKLALGSAVSLGTGAIVDLDKGPDEALDVFVNGRLFAKGRLLLVDGEWAVRLEQIVAEPAAVEHASNAGSGA